MIVEIAATALALLPPAAVAALPFALERHHSRAERARHAACLRSIDQLERELFPHWFFKTTPTNYVRVIPGAYSLSAVPARAGEVLPWLRDDEHIRLHALGAHIGLPLGEVRPLLALGLRVESAGIRVGDLRRLLRDTAPVEARPDSKVGS